MIQRPPVLPHVQRLRRLMAAVVSLAAAWHAQAEPSPASPAAAVEKVSSPEAGGLIRLGASLSGKGDYSTAEIAYRQVIDRPDFTIGDQKTALLGLAHMYRKAGALTKAVAIYEKFLKEFPEDPRIPDAFLDLGRTLREMGAYNLAFTRFYSVINTTLKVSPQEFDHYSLLAKTAQFEIAQTYYESGDYAEAGKFFTRVRLLDLSPADRARAHFMAGCAQERAGDLETAVTTLRAFLEQWPEDENVPEARYVLATALDELKRTQQALAVTVDLLSVEHSRVAADPRRWAYWQRRTGNQLANKFFQDGNTAEALTIYNCLIPLSPEPSWRLPVIYQTALCYERLFQMDRARAAYRAVIEAAKAKDGAPSPDVVELAGMAAWRMDHLEWRDGINHRLTNFLDPGSVPAATPAKTGGDAAPSPPS